MSMSSTRQFGFIKWFGGFNNKIERENNFGFVQLADGTDLYLHRKDWHGEAPPEALDVVTFFAETRNNRLCCRRAGPIRSIKGALHEIYQGLLALPECAPSPELSDGFVRLHNTLHEQFHLSLHVSPVDELRALCARSNADDSPFRIISAGPYAAVDYEHLLQATSTPVTSDEAWPLLPLSLLPHYEEQIATQLAGEKPSVIRAKADPVLGEIPAPVLVLLLAKGGYTHVAQLGTNYARIEQYVSEVVLNGSQTQPDYVLELGVDLLDWRWQCGNPLLQDLLDRFHFKKSLSERGTEFIAIYERSPALQRDLQYFILHQLFSLLAAGNVREVVYPILLQRLWEALISKQLTLHQQEKGLAELFPSCSVMRPLSCEAFFWRQDERKDDMFLCRSKRCHHPQVLPQPRRAVGNYSLYDWLHHWGIDYSNANKPHSRDFPIRIAGYFNRLREIYMRLHCRACSTLMVPHMNYARTSYKELCNGVVEVRQLSAAYRLTVFRCNDPDCVEYCNDHYINHCIGFNCYEVIDSRDLKRRCSAGRYICDACQSCCQEHGEVNRAFRVSAGDGPGSSARHGTRAAAPPHVDAVQAKYLRVTESDYLGNVPVGRASSVPTLEDISSLPWPDEFGV